MALFFSQTSPIFSGKSFPGKCDGRFVDRIKEEKMLKLTEYFGTPGRKRTEGDGGGEWGQGTGRVTCSEPLLTSISCGNQYIRVIICQGAGRGFEIHLSRRDLLQNVAANRIVDNCFLLFTHSAYFQHKTAVSSVQKTITSVADCATFMPLYFVRPPATLPPFSHPTPCVRASHPPKGILLAPNRWGITSVRMNLVGRLRRAAATLFTPTQLFPACDGWNDGNGFSSVRKLFSASKSAAGTNTDSFENKRFRYRGILLGGCLLVLCSAHISQPSRTRLHRANVFHVLLCSYGA